MQNNAFNEKSNAEMLDSSARKLLQLKSRLVDHKRMVWHYHFKENGPGEDDADYNFIVDTFHDLYQHVTVFCFTSVNQQALKLRRDLLKIELEKSNLYRKRFGAEMNVPLAYQAEPEARELLADPVDFDFSDRAEAESVKVFSLIDRLNLRNAADSSKEGAESFVRDSRLFRWLLDFDPHMFDRLTMTSEHFDAVCEMHNQYEDMFSESSDWFRKDGPCLENADWKRLEGVKKAFTDLIASSLAAFRRLDCNHIDMEVLRCGLKWLTFELEKRVLYLEVFEIEDEKNVPAVPAAYKPGPQVQKLFLEVRELLEELDQNWDLIKGPDAAGRASEKFARADKRARRNKKPLAEILDIESLEEEDDDIGFEVDVPQERKSEVTRCGNDFFFTNMSAQSVLKKHKPASKSKRFQIHIRIRDQEFWIVPRKMKRKKPRERERPGRKAPHITCSK